MEPVWCSSEQDPSETQYNTASAGLPPQELDGLSGIPDVTATSAARKKLQQLVDECTVQLEPYSRYLGRNPSAPDALEGLLQLPVNLWPPTAGTALDELKQRIGDGMVVMSFGELAGRLQSTGSLSRDKVLTLARALEPLHIGIEPDVLTGSRTPKSEDNVALFATQAEDGDLRSSPAYSAASVTLDLACAVAAADGDIVAAGDYAAFPAYRLLESPERCSSETPEGPPASAA